MAGEAGKVGTPPTHYAGEGLQPFDVIDAYGLGFYDGNALKYLLRWDKKGSPLGDLNKALHYIQELIIRWEKSGEVRSWPEIAFDADTLPENVAIAFGLTGKVSEAVFYLLHWRLCGSTPCLRIAQRAVECAIKEEEARG